jgi:hypothetical protein
MEVRMAELTFEDLLRECSVSIDKTYYAGTVAYVESINLVKGCFLIRDRIGKFEAEEFRKLVVSAKMLTALHFYDMIIRFVSGGWKFAEDIVNIPVVSEGDNLLENLPHGQNAIPAVHGYLVGHLYPSSAKPETPEDIERRTNQIKIQFESSLKKCFLTRRKLELKKVRK